MTVGLESSAGAGLHLHGGQRLLSAMAIAPLHADLMARLASPSSVRRFAIPIRMDNGRLRVFIGWRVIYSACFGPTKGGVRFASTVTEQDLCTLAFRILMKCAVNGLPHGGASGGVAVDPGELSSREKESLARGYVASLGRSIGPDSDILSPDLGTDATVMGWMADEYNKHQGLSIPAAINGKHPALGGIVGRPTATARGAWIVLAAVLRQRGLATAGMTFAVQGYGNAGGSLACLLQQNGLRLVAASDSSGGFYAPQGLDAEALLQAKRSGRPFGDLSFPNATTIPRETVLGLPADIVIPAATAQQIDATCAARMQCRMILELANAPITADAEALLIDKGVDIIPDIVANAGGITMSHFEWAQNRGGVKWSAAKAEARLDERMKTTVAALLDVARDRNVSLSIASQLLALEHLQAALAG